MSANIANRTETMTAVWAQNALTNNTNAIQGVSYRLPNPEANDFQNGQQYYEIFDSARWNALVYQITYLVKQLAQQGMLSWYGGEAYQTGAWCLGSDGMLYQAIQASDRDNQQNPVNNPTYWRSLTSIISAQVPNASTTVRGIVELATNAETLAGTDAVRAVTPAGLSSANLSPVGSVMMHAATAAPTNWLICNGSAISRTTYSSLFSAIGTAWGTGNGSTTFNIPDFRGTFLRGWNGSSSGLDPSRSFASLQNHAFQNFTGTFGISNDTAGAVSGVFSVGASTSATSGSGSGNVVTFNPATVASTASETRPSNYAINYIIRAF